MNTKVVEVLTSRVLEQLRDGRIPWRKPWHVSAWPHNAVSKRVYHGFNVFALNISAHCMQYTNHAWLTFKQAQSAGALIRKGEHATPIAFWNWLDIEETDSAGNTKKKHVPFLRYYRVFNVCQLEELGKIDTETVATDIPEVQSADDIISAYHGPAISHDSPGQAYYAPLTDSIHMSPRETHIGVGEYYSTMFHELVHSTGHSSRLDRLEPVSFRSHAYSKEELVAEIGATLLCSIAGIDTDMDNHASYVAAWLSKLEEKPEMLITAAGAAQKAVDFMRHVKNEEVAA